MGYHTFTVRGVTHIYVINHIDHTIGKGQSDLPFLTSSFGHTNKVASQILNPNCPRVVEVQKINFESLQLYIHNSFQSAFPQSIRISVILWKCGLKLHMPTSDACGAGYVWWCVCGLCMGCTCMYV
jgi:hypothetical protein